MITIVSSTNRTNSNSFKVATSCREILLSKNYKTELFSLEKLPKDFVFSSSFGKRTNEFENVVFKYIHPADKLIFIIPEYNGSFPGVLKAFIDTLDFINLSGKKAALIGLSSGHAGALRALDQFTHILHHLKIEVFSDKPKLSGIEKLIDNKEISDNKAIARVEGMLEKFLGF